MLIVAKITVILFGIFIVLIGWLMLLAPDRARNMLKKAGNTPFINYAEISLRMIPAAALVLSAPQSKFPQIFQYFGWFMLITSLILFLVPRKLHHEFALNNAERLKEPYVRLLSPFSMLFGLALIYAVWPII